MAIDFTFPADVEDIRLRVRDFMEQVVSPAERAFDETDWRRGLVKLRAQAQEAGLGFPPTPTEGGGMGLGHVPMAAVSAEAARTRYGPFVLNAQAPDEGNM